MGDSIYEALKGLGELQVKRDENEMKKALIKDQIAGQRASDFYTFMAQAGRPQFLKDAVTAQNLEGLIEEYGKFRTMLNSF